MVDSSILLCVFLFILLLLRKSLGGWIFVFVFHSTRVSHSESTGLSNDSAIRCHLVFNVTVSAFQVMRAFQITMWARASRHLSVCLSLVSRSVLCSKVRSTRKRERKNEMIQRPIFFMFVLLHLLVVVIILLLSSHPL